MLSTYLRDVLLELDPDLVILYYGKNTEMQFNHTMLPVMERLVEEHPWIDSSMEMAAAMELRWPGRIMVWAYLRAMDLRSFVLLREAAIAVADRLRDEEDLRRAEELTPWRSLSVPWMPGLTDLAPTTRRVVEMCRARQVKVLLVPEIVDPELWPDEIPYRAIFADLADPPAVTLLRVDERMLEPPRSEVFLDDVHLTDEGCRILAAALTPTVLSLLPALLPEAGDTVAPGDAEAGADGGPVPPAPD